MVPDYMKWLLSGFFASGIFLYGLSAITNNLVYHFLAIAFFLPVAIFGIYELKQAKQEREKKYAEEMDALKQKERQLYVDALNEWIESPDYEDGTLTRNQERP